MRQIKQGRCYWCSHDATARAWAETGYGPGGGIDPIWGIVPSCDKHADVEWGAYLSIPHILPDNPGLTRRVLS